MTLSESVRQAATIKDAISTYVATAALAVMAGALVIYTYVSSSFQESWLFHALIFIGLVRLVLSIFIGGRASGEVTDAVAVDIWNPSITKQGLIGGSSASRQSLPSLGWP